MSLVGARVIRKEDPNLITGRGTFVDDIRPAGCLWMAFVRSTEAHATITSVDKSAAEAMRGVHGVWTLDDLADLPPLPGVPGMERHVLARAKARFVGEPVAVLVADDRYVAADAAEAVVVNYDPLPVVVSVQAAMAEGAAIVLDEIQTNVPFGIPAEDQHDEVFANAPHTASIHLVNQRCAPTPIETQGCVADYGPEGLTMHITFQAPHHMRNAMSAWLGVPQHTVRIISPDIGGAFGSKIVFSPEYFLTAALSKKLGRPVKFVQTRSEAMVLTTHGRDQVHDAEVAFDDDGKILGLRVNVVQNVGAWPDPTGMGLGVLTTWMTSGVYKIPKIAASFSNCLTNTTPVAAYRGAGRPEAAYMVERVIDLVADELGLDAAEVRYRNFIQFEDMPYPSATNEAVCYDSGNFPAAMDELLRLMDYETLKVAQAERNADLSQPLMGIGFSVWIEIAGFGPNGSLEGFGHIGSWESASVRITPDGNAIIATGLAPHGQGNDTAFAQIAADELGIDFEKITVIHGDTETIQQGIGTMGSRAIPLAGEGVKNASIKIRDTAKEIAAHLLEANPADLLVEADTFTVAGSPDKSVTWAEVATASFQPLQLPVGTEPGGLNTTVFQTAPNFSYPSGAYGCIVGIDRDTGAVNVERYVLIDDCGTVINPLLAEGQVHGGAAQGIAQALFEHMSYDEAGQPQTSTLIDYLVPSAADLPGFEAGRIVTVTPNNTLGAKGIGESGAVGAPPAVVNAVVDALSGFGVRHVDMPVTPEKVWRLLSAANGAADAAAT